MAHSCSMQRLKLGFEKQMLLLASVEATQLLRPLLECPCAILPTWQQQREESLRRSRHPPEFRLAQSAALTVVPQGSNSSFHQRISPGKTDDKPREPRLSSA